MLVFMLPGALVHHAQEGISQKKQEKRPWHARRKEEKKAKKRRKGPASAILSIQDKETRKRMKRNTKRADRSGSGPASGWLLRRACSAQDDDARTCIRRT
ncbi:MAG: hypothetical protein IPO05_02585 [Flavobacteriales bacterium]|nr:hypothetical protein [Flavobacteriales bacterium]